jgi:hypothetical protein
MNQRPALRGFSSLLPLALATGSAALVGCNADIGEVSTPGTGPTSVAGSGNPVPPPSGGGTTGQQPSAGGTGNVPGTANGGTVASGGTAAGAPPASGGAAAPLDCTAIAPGRAPLRRLTTNEFNSTVLEVLGDATNPGSEFPSEILGKGFGNDADLQSVSDLLAEKYYSVAESVAARATENAAALGRLHTCASNVAAADEESCARSIVTDLLPRAFRRDVTATEIDEFVGLYKSTRALATSVSFGSGIAAVVTALLQSPEFLYRLEFGTEVPGNPAVRALTGNEIATRLSYLFWQRPPDAGLTQAAASGALATREGVLAQAERLLADQKSHAMVGFFFDNLLPITNLSNLTRDKQLFPMFSASIGAAMRREVQRMLEYEIFENTMPHPGSPYAPGSWPAALTAPYTFVNQTLFDFYGADSFVPGASVTGEELKKVDFNPAQRLGLLSLAGMMAGTATTNLTNPVLRGGFVVKHLMCREIPLPSFAVAPPEPYTGKTARERFSKHSAEDGCSGCHQFMDPIGLALENYDAVGRFRTTERAVIDGVTYDTPIDASGSVPGVPGTASGPIDLIRLLATSEEAQACFATSWMQFAYGRVLDAGDACNKQTIHEAFKSNGYNVKQLLLQLTQTDAFRYRPAQ